MLRGNSYLNLKKKKMEKNKIKLTRIAKVSRVMKKKREKKIKKSTNIEVIKAVAEVEKEKNGEKL